MQLSIHPLFGVVPTVPVSAEALLTAGRPWDNCDRLCDAWHRDGAYAGGDVVHILNHERKDGVL